MYKYLDAWYSIKTLSDYQRVLNEVPSYYQLGEELWRSHKHIAVFSNRGFWKICNLPEFTAYMIDTNTEFKNWEYHTEGYLPIGESNDFNDKFSYGFDRYPLYYNTKQLKALMELGFYKNYGYVAGLHRQKPGDIKSIHYDHYTKIYTDLPFAKDTIFNTTTRQVEHRGLQLLSLFIFVDDQKPGQGIGYLDENNKSKYLTWKAGDVYCFNWRTTPHWTFNSSYTERDIILLTGFNDGTVSAW